MAMSRSGAVLASCAKTFSLLIFSILLLYPFQPIQLFFHLHFTINQRHFPPEFSGTDKIFAQIFAGILERLHKSRGGDGEVPLSVLLFDGFVVYFDCM